MILLSVDVVALLSVKVKLAILSSVRQHAALQHMSFNFKSCDRSEFINIAVPGRR